MSTANASVAPARKERWSKTKTLNIVCGLTIAWLLAVKLVGAFVHLGVDPQPTPCLPWRYFIVGQQIPDSIERGKIYMYRAYRIPMMPNGIHVAKYAGAIAGDHVVVNEQGIFVNGHLWGPLNKEVMMKGRMTMDDVRADYVVPTGKVLMLGTMPNTWDGRYWGLVKLDQIDGKAVPLW